MFERSEGRRRKLRSFEGAEEEGLLGLGEACRDRADWAGTFLPLRPSGDVAGLCGPE